MGYRENERELAAEEAAVLKDQWSHEEEEAKRVEAIRREMTTKAHQELLEYNQHKLSEIERLKSEEQVADSAELNYQLQKERDAVGREQAARNAMAAETRMFAEHVRAQKQQQKQI